MQQKSEWVHVVNGQRPNCRLHTYSPVGSICSSGLVKLIVHQHSSPRARNFRDHVLESNQHCMRACRRGHEALRQLPVRRCYFCSWHFCLQAGGFSRRSFRDYMARQSRNPSREARLKLGAAAAAVGRPRFKPLSLLELEPRARTISMGPIMASV